MKKAVTITMDVDVWEIARAKSINLSSVINKMLKDYLAPTPVDEQAEEKILGIVKFGKSFGLTPEQSAYTYKNLHLDVTSIWKHFKQNFSPDFNIYDWMEIRKQFSVKYPDAVHGKIKDSEQRAQEIIDAEADDLLKNLGSK